MAKEGDATGAQPVDIGCLNAGVAGNGQGVAAPLIDDDEQDVLGGGLRHGGSSPYSLVGPTAHFSHQYGECSACARWLAVRRSPALRSLALSSVAL